MASRKNITFKPAVFTMFLAVCILIALLTFLLGYQIGRVNGVNSDRANVQTPSVQLQTDNPSIKPSSHSESYTFFHSLNKKTPPSNYSNNHSNIATKHYPSAKSTTKSYPTVRPEATKPPATTYNHSRNGEFFVIQVASVKELPKAKKLVKLLKKHGFPAYIEKNKTHNTTMFRVRVGHFKSKNNAKSIANKIHRQEKLNTWVTSSN